MGFSYELFYLNTETESLGEVQGFGTHECRAMGCTIQWRKGSGYPKNLNTETESLGEVKGYGMHECWAMGCTSAGLWDARFNGEKGVGTLRI